MARLILLTTILALVLGAAPAGAAGDPVADTLRNRAVVVQPGAGTPAQASLLRAEARRLLRLGYPTKFALLAGPIPGRFIAYSGVVRRAVGPRWNVVLVWSARGRPAAFSIDSPASAPIERRAVREADRALADRPVGSARFAADLAARLSWYQQPVNPPLGGRRLNLDGDPDLERLVKVRVGIRFPRNSFPGYRWAIVDGDTTTRVGTPGERLLAPLIADHIGAGSPQLLLRSGSGNATPGAELISWDGGAARTLWRFRASDLARDLPAGRFIDGYSSLTFPDLDGDGIAEILVESPVLSCRACAAEGLRLATYRLDQTTGRFALEQVQATRT